MAISISSHFQYQMEKTNPSSVIVKFTYNNSDISEHVLKYKTIARETSKLISGNFTIDLENASQGFNSYLTDRTQFLKNGKLEYGFATDAGSEDLITLFKGELKKASFSEQKLTLSFQDKLDDMSGYSVGASDAPVEFYTGIYTAGINPAELAWTIVTCYGQLSNIKSTSNPDISYSHWAEWSQIFSDNSVMLQSVYTGATITEILKDLEEISDSVIYAENDNKIYFSRWQSGADDSFDITEDTTAGKVSIKINATQIVNEATVLYDYNVDSEQWAGTLTEQNTVSINSFGTFAKEYRSEEIWYVDSVSAINFAQRLVARRKKPNTTCILRTPLTYINAQLGDTINLTSQIYSFDARNFTLLGKQIDIDKGTIKLKLDDGFSSYIGRTQGFLLDDATNGLLDQTYNPLL